MMKRTIFIVVGIVSCLTLKAQNRIKPLQVGDKCPDFLFQHISNTNKLPVRLSDFKGKLVILDFGGLGGCPPCIKGALELDSLMRNEFKDKIASIYCMSKHAWGDEGPSLAERKRQIVFYLHNDKRGKQLHQIVDWGDTTLSDYFPHRLYPHMVWIGKDGTVLAITSQDYLKPEYIREALTKKSLQWETKYDVKSGLDLNEPFVVYNQMNTPYLNGDSSVRYYSTFLNYLPGLNRYSLSYFNGNGVRYNVQGKKRIVMINQPIAKMYYDLLCPGNDVSKIIYEVRDQLRYDVFNGMLGKYKPNTIESPDWRRKNTYGYDGIFPSSLSKDDIIKRVVDEINYSLGLNGRMEQRNVKVWAVTSSLKYSKQFEVMSSNIADSIYREGRTGGYITIGNLLWELAHREGSLPIVDETHFTEESLKSKYVKISAAALKSREMLNDELMPYGLSITEGKRQLEMLVITENGYNQDEK